MKKDREGQLSKINVNPHEDITRDADQLLHEPEHASEAEMSDQQENVAEHVRLSIRMENAMKFDFSCDTRDVPAIREALKKVNAEIQRTEPETLAREIEEAMSGLVEDSVMSDETGTSARKSRLQFLLPSGAPDGVSLVTDRDTERQVEALFVSAGWTVFAIDRADAF